jgi:hypothetical protein
MARLVTIMGNTMPPRDPNDDDDDDEDEDEDNEPDDGASRRSSESLTKTNKPVRLGDWFTPLGSGAAACEGANASITLAQPNADGS